MRAVFNTISVVWYFMMTSAIFAELIEPSGLVLVGEQFFTVSDTKSDRFPENKIYEVNRKGEVIRTIFAGIGVGNLEGITFHRGQFYVISEDGFINFYDRHFSHRGSFLLSESIRKYVREENSGFEGIASDGDHLYVLIEKENLFLIRIDTHGNELAKWDLRGLGLRDHSDVTFDDNSDWVFVVSHESKAVAGFSRLELTPEKSLPPRVTKAKKTQEIDARFYQQIPNDPKQAEGIAVDDNTIYIISDRDAKWCTMDKPRKRR